MTDRRHLLSTADVSVDDLARIVEAEVDLSEFPQAYGVESNVLVYDGSAIPTDVAGQMALEAEVAHALDEGPGVLVFKSAFARTEVVDAATRTFLDIIERERAAGGDQGDHFGTPGANARVWNAQEKLARKAPDTFVEYFANEAIALGARAWLGPNYQMTAQVNLVHPGGRAQEPHCDYHLGFCTNEQAEAYPAPLHALSPFLTLQGAVAHCDMPVSSGPTMFLPFSQRYPLRYLAYRDSGVKKLFARRMVQIPLEKGDVVYFSPGLLHGAGTNHTTDIERMANLLQVSSAFGRAMESMDRLGMCEAIYPALQRATQGSDWSDRDTANVIASCAEGYSFPTNLDRDQPIGGLAPMSQAEILAAAVARGASAAELSRDLRAHRERTLP